MKWVGLLSRLVLAGVWLAAGLLKLGDPAESVRAVRAYELLPEALVLVVGYSLPVCEVAVGLLLLAGVATRAAGALSVGLLVAFVVGIASAWARGLSIECGCFGGGGGPAVGASDKYPWEIARDLGLLLLSAWLVWRPRSAYSLDDLMRSHRPRRHITAGVLAAALAATAAGYAVQSNRDETGTVARVPAGFEDTYVLAVGPVGAPVVLDLYEDPLCPYCGQFARASRALVDGWLAQDAVRVRYHLIAFLDRASTDRYSTRALNAVAVVADAAGPDVAKRFHDLLFAHQPAEGTDGLTDDQLADLAVQADAERSAVVRGIESLQFEGWVKNATDQASRDGVNSTPTVLVDGVQVPPSEIAQMVAVLDQAVTARLPARLAQ